VDIGEAETLTRLHPRAARAPGGNGAGNGHGPSIDVTVSDAAGARSHAEPATDDLGRRNTFLATLAHELRNPLAPIRNAVQILRADGTPPAGREFAVDVIDRQVAHLSRLIDDLMDLARVTTGRLDLRVARVDLRDVLQEAIETSRPIIESSGVDLAVVLPPRAVVVDGDATRLAQVVSNLLNNAARYTQRGGRVDLSVEALRSETVISVRDTGIGIPPEMLERVFDMFARASQTAGRAPGALGIGLTLARQIVELHHGTIAAESDGPGLGSLFTVRLPRPADSESPRHVEVPHLTVVSAGLRILVIDDNVDSAETMGMFLGALGHDIRVGHDGIEAVMIASDFHPDVMLLDIGLPGQSGYDVARAVRTEAWAGDLCLVAVSGWSQDSDRARSREAGFDHHLVKPVDHVRLQEILRATAAHRRQT
jgi:signal transduction histidine kinase/ActR/RegA family two-component response regulator